MNTQNQEFHTGLFLDQNKRHVLLDIVQDLLRTQYRLVAVTGPSLPNCTCEVLLRSLNLHTSDADIANAKVLLEKYLIMIKESRPNMLVGKEPELIDLEASDDDEPMDSTSVIIVDLDESDISGEGQSSDAKNSPNATLDNSEIIVVDSLRTQDLSPKSTSPTASTNNVLKNSQNKEKCDPVIGLDDSDVIDINPIKSPSSSKLPSPSVSTSDALNYSQDYKENSASIKNLVDSEKCAPILNIDNSHSPHKLPSLRINTSDALSESQDRSALIQKSVNSNIVVINTPNVNLNNSDVIDVNPLKSHSPSKLPSVSVSTSDVLKYSQYNKEKSAPIQNSFDSDIVVIDSTEGQISLPKSLSSSNDTKGVLTESNKQAKNRKRNKEKEPDKGRPIEVVDILDDDIIVVDDSFSTSIPSRIHSTLSEPEVLVVEPNKALSSQSKQPSTTSSCNNEVQPSSSNTSTHPPHPESSQVCKSTSNNGESECGNVHEDKSLSSHPPKKKSKLTYHRPAHLIAPLTLPTPGIPSTKTETSSNIYNPNAGTSAEKRTGLRPVVIDGNNVALGHGKGTTFSLKGIQICINYFEKRGHRHIKVFVPQYRKNRDNHDELHKMERKGLIVITPSRKVNGKVVASYDDRYIVQYAAELGGVIVSTDNYRDLMNENPSWKETIENRLLMFTWVDDLLMFPQDPLGRRGPSLDEFLKYPDT